MEKKIVKINQTLVTYCKKKEYNDGIKGQEIQIVLYNKKEKKKL